VKRLAAVAGVVVRAILARLGVLPLRRRRAPVVVLTGERGVGKTTLAAEVVERLRATGVRVGGILAPGTVKEGRRHSFDLVALATGERRLLACRDPEPGWVEERCFWADPAAVELGHAALGAEDADVVVVDEVGPWELEGSGWSADLDVLVRRDVRLLLVVRHKCLRLVLARWRLAAAVFEAGEGSAEEIAAVLAK